MRNVPHVRIVLVSYFWCECLLLFKMVQRFTLWCLIFGGAQFLIINYLAHPCFHALPLILYVLVHPFQDLVAKYSQQMVKGMLQLLTNCPSETAHLRKELLIAAKHILTTDLRSRTYILQ